MKDSKEAKPTEYKGYTIITVGFYQQKRFVIAHNGVYVSGKGEYRSKSEAKKVINGMPKVA